CPSNGRTFLNASSFLHIKEGKKLRMQATPASSSLPPPSIPLVIGHGDDGGDRFGVALKRKGSGFLCLPGLISRSLFAEGKGFVLPGRHGIGQFLDTAEGLFST